MLRWGRISATVSFRKRPHRPFGQARPALLHFLAAEIITRNSPVGIFAAALFGFPADALILD